MNIIFLILYNKLKIILKKTFYLRNIICRKEQEAYIKMLEECLKIFALSHLVTFCLGTCNWTERILVILPYILSIELVNLKIANK